MSEGWYINVDSDVAVDKLGSEVDVTPGRRVTCPVIFFFLSFLNPDLVLVPRFELTLVLSYNQRNSMAEIHNQFDTILIFDFGSQVRPKICLFVFLASRFFSITRRCV